MTQTDEKKKPISKKVDHAYRDYSHVTPDIPTEDIDYEDCVPGATLPTSTRSTDSNFPAKLHHILSQPDLAHIVTWLPHGRSWRILDRKAFSIYVLPNYFSHSNEASFFRQVNGWSFKRLSRRGNDYGSYYHELFLRGMPHVAKRMRRPLKIGKRVCSDPKNEPNLEEISRIHPLPELSQRSKGLVAGLSNDLSIIFSNSPIAPASNSTDPSIAFLLDNANLTVNPAGLSQGSPLQSIRQGLEPQDSSIQTFLNQNNRTNFRLDTSNYSFLSNLIDSNNIVERLRLNPLGSQNITAFGTQDQEIQLALQRLELLRELQSNISTDHSFPLQPAEILSDSRISRSNEPPL